MPAYTFLNTKTNEQYDTAMSYEALQTYLSDNPHIEQVFKMNICDPVIIGVSQPPVDFTRHVLGKVKQMPGANKNAMEKRWVPPKEV
jgi:hypothetical protein